MTRDVFQVKNEYKYGVAKNIITEVCRKIPNASANPPVLFLVADPIFLGSSRVDTMDIPTSFQIVELSFCNVNYVC